ncbi:MAG: ferric reductase-like transmembrane domain-containing protein [Acidobacteria bacterium]|nr:ferric reductase-like transmembrane domain-containing protein [Acidobacteriota bacterium]
MVFAASASSIISRAGGIIAWLLIATSMVWGVVLSSRLLRRANLPVWLLGLHRTLAVAGTALAVVHVLGAIGDHRIGIGLTDALVPGRSEWRTGAITWGVVSMYLLVAVTITSVLMRRMPRRLWHLSHLLAYPLFIASTLHAYQAGTVRSNRLLLWGGLALAEVVVGMSLFRLFTYLPTRRAQAARADAPVAK